MLMYYAGNNKNDIDILKFSLTEMDLLGQSCKKYEEEFTYLINLVVSNKQMTLCRFIFLQMHLVTEKGVLLWLLVAVVNISFFPMFFLNQ